MIDPGTDVLVESPTYLAALQVFRFFGANFTSFPIGKASETPLGQKNQHFCTQFQRFKIHQGIVTVNQKDRIWLNFAMNMAFRCWKTTPIEIWRLTPANVDPYAA